VNVTVEHAPNSEAILTIELEWSELERASERAYHRLAQRYNVPGFRRGHAPRSMLERMLGRETLYQEGLESLIEDSYREALRSNQLKPLAEPTIDAPPLQMDQPYRFTVRVPVRAPVELGDYHAARVEQPNVQVTDEDIEKVVRDLQEQQALWVPVERPAQIGDQVIADVKLTVGDRTISNLTDNEFVLAEHREGIFSGMDQHVVGMSEGETKEFTSTIPADYANTELAEQETHYTATLKGVKVRELPEIDDEMARSAGSYETLDDLRAAIREQLRARREANARREFRERLLKAVTDQATVEIHPTLVTSETETMVRETRQLLEQSNFSMSQFLASSHKTEEELRTEFEPEARERVKRELVLDAIADAEGIQASDQEVQSWLDLLANTGAKRRRARQLSPAQRQYVAGHIRRDKAAAHLIEAASATGPDTGEADKADEAAVVTGALRAAQVGAGIAGEAVDMPKTPEAPAADEAATGETPNGMASADGAAAGEKGASVAGKAKAQDVTAPPAATEAPPAARPDTAADAAPSPQGGT
jgi:trigger factor